MTAITDKQKQLLQHMLGADSRYKKKQWGFRNHYCASDDPQCPERLELEKMEELGLVTSGERLGYKTFWATTSGAVAIGFKPYQLRNANLAIVSSMKKNCYNCMHGHWDQDIEDHYVLSEYFVCEKRDDGNDTKLEINLSRHAYRDKAKVCCELSSNR